MKSAAAAMTATDKPHDAFVKEDPERNVSRLSLGPLPEETMTRPRVPAPPTAPRYPAHQSKVLHHASPAIRSGVADPSKRLLRFRRRGTRK